MSPANFYKAASAVRAACAASFLLTAFIALPAAADDIVAAAPVAAPVSVSETGPAIALNTNQAAKPVVKGHVRAFAGKKRPGFMRRMLEPVTELQSQSIALQEQIVKLEKPIEDLQPPMIRLHQRFIAVEGQMSDLHGSLGGIQSELATVHNDIGTVWQQITKLEQPIGALQEPVNRIYEPIVNLHKPIDNLHSDIGALRKQIDDLRTPVLALNKPVESLQKPVEALYSPVVGLRQDIDGLKGELGNLKGTLNKLTYLVEITIGIASLLLIVGAIATVVLFVALLKKSLTPYLHVIDGFHLSKLSKIDQQIIADSRADQARAYAADIEELTATI